MEEACTENGISLKAPALRMSVRDPRAASTIVGTATPADVDELLALVSQQLPQELCEELEALAPPETQWLR